VLGLKHEWALLAVRGLVGSDRAGRVRLIRGVSQRSRLLGTTVRKLILHVSPERQRPLSGSAMLMMRIPTGG